MEPQQFTDYYHFFLIAAPLSDDLPPTFTP